MWWRLMYHTDVCRISLMCFQTIITHSPLLSLWAMGYAPAHKISFSITIWRLIISEMTLLHIWNKVTHLFSPPLGKRTMKSFKLDLALDLMQSIWQWPNFFKNTQISQCYNNLTFAQKYNLCLNCMTYKWLLLFLLLLEYL